MTTLKEAAQQALEALDTLYRSLSPESVLASDLKRRADALRKALEQPEQAMAHGDIRALKYRIHELEGEVIGYKRIIEEAALKKLADLGQEIEQEPICPECKAAVLYECVACSSNNYPTRTSADTKNTPAAAQRKPLTDEWIQSRCNQGWVFETVKQWVREVEAAHGIKEGT